MKRNIQYPQGDGVTERTKTSIATHTGAGSIPRPRAPFFFGQVTVSGEQVPPSHTQAWQIPTGAQSKNSAKTNTRV